MVGCRRSKDDGSRGCKVEFPLCNVGLTDRDLNRNQRRAVEWNDGPLLVLGGPGAGKTAVLTLRIARLLEEDDDAAALGLACTDKAATEMRERVDQILGEHTDRAQLRTFHKFAADILGQHGSHLGIRPDFQLITRDEDRVAILDEVTAGLPGGRGRLPADRNNLFRLVDRLFSESYSGEGRSSSLTSTPAWLPLLFRRYCDALIGTHRLDHPSLLFFANRLLTEKPAVARVVRLGWTHICVDEFEDMNRAQYDLLRLIAPGRRHNLFVVADDDPIVHRWNGASRQRFRDLRGDYELGTIWLPESYRCPPGILDHANRLIAYDPGVIEAKETVSVREPRLPCDGVVRHRVFRSLAAEAEFVGRDIRERGLLPADCVVLARTNRLIHAVADGVRSAGLEAFVPQRKGDFDSPVLAVMVEVLRLADSRHDRVVLRSVCREWERLTGVVLGAHAVGVAAALVGGDFLRAWVDAAGAAGGVDRDLLRRVRRDLVDRLDFASVVDWLLEEGWESWGAEGLAESTAEEVGRWKALHRDIIREHGDGVTLHEYLPHFDLSSEATSPGPNAVRCFTVHRSRGLEFRHVYLIGMAQAVFPSYRGLRRGSGGVEEERRSCFAAITKARETVTVTRATEYFGYGRRASQFLGEMGVGGDEKSQYVNLR